MSAKASIPPGALAQNLLATVDASADPARPPIHPDTLALYDLWLASGANTAPPPGSATGDGSRGEALIKSFRVLNGEAHLEQE